MISRVWSTGKMKFEACPVDPPGLGSGPWSSCTMSVQPSSARWWTRLLPTMPAPMTTTLAVAGTVAMETPAVLRIMQRMRNVKLRTSISPALPGCQARVPGTARRSRAHDDADQSRPVSRARPRPCRGSRRSTWRQRPPRTCRPWRSLADRVLVVVGPLERLDHVDGRAAFLDPGRRTDLLQRRLRVVAGDLGRVVLATLGVRRELDGLQRVLGEEPLRLVEVADQPRPCSSRPSRRPGCSRPRNPRTTP